MNRNKFWAAASRVSAVVTVMLIVILILAPGAGAASRFKILYDFTGGTNGYDPFGGMIFDGLGNLYGTMLAGGATNHGTVFKLTPNPDGSWSEDVLYSFCSSTKCPDGKGPYAGLIFDQAGNLYGTTYLGGAYGHGVVFKLTPNGDSSWTETVLHSFNGKDGHSPQSSLIFDAAGNLYGTTVLGGGRGRGVVFKLTSDADGSWTDSTIHRFTGGTDGASPYSALVLDAEGSLYGTTYAGGNLSFCGGAGCGVVYKLSPNVDGSWKEKVLHRFTGGNDGRGPWAGLIFDPEGNLYGTTLSGGNLSFCGGAGCGAVFKLSPNVDGSWKEKVLHRFSGKDGGGPYGRLIFDRGGNLYGTTGSGGTSNGGTAFELTPQPDGKWKEKVLHQFMGGEDGWNPMVGVILDQAGSLYGTTVGGGTKEFGVVFEITP